MSWLKFAAEEDAGSKELAMGRKVETEHTATIKWLIEQLSHSAGQSDVPVEKLIAEATERIAQDHLRELPDYYTRLKRMEEGAKAPAGSEG